MNPWPERTALHYKNVMLKSLTLLGLSWQSCFLKLAGETSGETSTNSAPLNMKTPHSFSQNRFASCVRFATAGTLLCAALAMAFVTIKSPTSTLTSSQDPHRAITKFRGDPDQVGKNKLTLPGDRDLGPMLAAMEDYSHRAYPAKDVPMHATLNALAGFKHVQRMSRGRRAAGG